MATTEVETKDEEQQFITLNKHDSSENINMSGNVSSIANDDTFTKFKERKTHHSLMSIYMSTFPLSLIFLLDILPSRISLIIVGHVTSDLYSFNSIFLSYSFTNFFSVFILSLSCGLDTLTKHELKNIVYLRYSLLCVILGFIPYIISCIYAENILISINQSILIIEQTIICIKLLIPYAVSYIIFAMLRKSLLQFLHTSLLIGFMFARLCLHLILGYGMYFYSNMGFYSFLLSDSISMIVLLLITLFNLARWISFKDFLVNLFSNKKGIINNRYNNNSNNNIPNNYFKKYVSATLIPGSISCLEWWAVETFTFLVGATRYIAPDNILSIFFVHSIWSSILLIFQMPMLGLSVAMAAIITHDIRKQNYKRARFTLVQALGTVIVYCAVLTVLVIFFYDKFIYIFFNYNGDTILISQVNNYTSEIIIFFVLSLFGYSVAMCFLGIFVSVGRLATGGAFMLFGYYFVGLLLSIILGFILNWKFYGIWFGYSCGFIVWCLLSILYWSCVDWKQEMKAMKLEYDKNALQLQITQNKTDYGSINIDGTSKKLNFNYNKYININTNDDDSDDDINIDDNANDLLTVNNNNTNDSDNDNELI